MRAIPVMLLRALIRVSYYPTLGFSRLMNALGRWNRWDAVDEHVLVGAVPSSRDLAKLHALGVGALVNLCEEFRGDEAALRQHRIEQLCLPTTDYFAPSEADIRRGISFMRDQVARGEKVYVHCKAGRARSATLVLCYLMAAHRCSAQEAYARLKAVRPHVSRGLDQRAVVAAIERSVRAGEWVSAAPQAAAAPTTGSK